MRERRLSQRWPTRIRVVAKGMYGKQSRSSRGPRIASFTDRQFCHSPAAVGVAGGQGVALARTMDARSVRILQTGPNSRGSLRRARWTPKWTPKELRRVVLGNARLCLVTSEDRAFWRCKSDGSRPIPARASKSIRGKTYSPREILQFASFNYARSASTGQKHRTQNGGGELGFVSCWQSLASGKLSSPCQRASGRRGQRRLRARRSG